MTTYRNQSKAKNTLKAWAAQMARDEAKKRLVEPKQAPYVEPWEMKNIENFFPKTGGSIFNLNMAVWL